MSPHKGYMNIAIAAMLFVAAFAGVALIANEDVAAEETQEYTVTYSYDGFVFSEKTTNGKLAVKDFNGALAAAKAPKGYAFDYWVAGSAIYKANTGTDKPQFAGDVTLEPVFKAAESIVKLVYGDVEKEYFGHAAANSEYIVTLENLADFAKAIGATVSGTITNECLVLDDKTVLNIDGFKFIGFKKVGADAVTAINALKGGSTASITTYVAVFDPVYNISFIVDGVKVSECKTTSYEKPFDPVKANYTFMGWAVDGNIISKLDKGDIVIPDEFIKSLTADTAFTAVFKPVQLTLTLVVGEFQTTQPALYGQKITAPGLPDGYSHWATMAIVDEKEVYTEFDFSQEIVESMTLYAQKAEKVYTISFVSEGAVIGGPYDVSKPYTIPVDPVVDGKKFVGWFVGDFKVADIKAYVAEHPDEDIVLTAFFTQADAPSTVYNVIFEIEGKAPITQKSDSMALPDTTREGYVFQGWLVKGETGYVEPMKYDITSDITFVAVYKQADPPAGPGFFETNEGKCVAVIIGVALLAFVYAVYTNMFGMKDFLTSIKIQRVKKE